MNVRFWEQKGAKPPPGGPKKTKPDWSAWDSEPSAPAPGAAFATPKKRGSSKVMTILQIIFTLIIALCVGMCLYAKNDLTSADLWHNNMMWVIWVLAVAIVLDMAVGRPTFLRILEGLLVVTFFALDSRNPPTIPLPGGAPIIFTAKWFPFWKPEDPTISCLIYGVLVLIYLAINVAQLFRNGSQQPAPATTGQAPGGVQLVEKKFTIKSDGSLTPANAAAPAGAPSF